MTCIQVTYRPEYQHGWGSKTYYTQLRLDPLPPMSANEFLQALLGDEVGARRAVPLQPLMRLLIARTEGNPFFLAESVRTPVETGVLAGEPGAYRLVKPLDNLQVPAAVQAVLAARIDRLPPEEKGLLQTAAVIGHEVSLPLLQAIADMPEEVLHRSLTHLQAAEFLYETRLFPEREYTFKHALTHEVAYGSLLQERRRALLEEAISVTVHMGTLLNHSHRVAQFSEVCRLAGRGEEAWQHAHQALDLARQLKERGNEAYALHQLGIVHAPTDPPAAEQAEAHYQQALALAEELGMRPLQAHCHHGLGTLYAVTGQQEQARAELSTAIELYRAMEMTFWLPQAEALLARIGAAGPMGRV